MYFNTNYTLIVILFMIILFICHNHNKENLNKLNKSNRIISLLDNEDNKKKVRKCPGVLQKFCKQPGDEYIKHGELSAIGSEINCDDVDDNPVYCNFTGNSADTNDRSLCTLTPELGPEETTIVGHTNPAPACSTVPCPENYKIINLTEGGLCYNESSGDTCALDAERAGEYDLCENKPDYIINKNIDIISPSTRDLTIHYERESSVSECADLCNRIPATYNSSGSENNKIIGSEKTIEANDEGGCDFFTYRKEGIGKGGCNLKKYIAGPNNPGDNTVRKNKSVDTYMKLPLNYKLYDNMDITGNSLNTYTNKTTMECADLCNKNNKCESFVSGKNSIVGQCELKGRLKNNLTPFYNKAAFSVNYKYQSDPDEETINFGTLCKFKDEVGETRQKIKDNLLQEDGENKHEKQIIIDKNTALLNDLETKVLNKTKKKTLNFFINPKAIIMWTRVNTICKSVEIELLRESYLQVAYIQIFGNLDINISKITDLINGSEIRTGVNASSSLSKDDYNEIIKMSDYYADDQQLENHVQNCYVKPDLEYFFSTDHEKNPKITIKFHDSFKDAREVRIDKIYIYNRIDSNQANLVPIKIKLLNRDGYIVREAVKESFKTPIKISNPPPIVPDSLNKDYYELGIGSDLGEPNMIREWVNLNSNKTNTYCSIIKDYKNKSLNNKDLNKIKDTESDKNLNINKEIDDDNYHYKLRCVNIDDINNPYYSTAINPGYIKSQYFKDETNTGRLDFCRCIGAPPHTYVSCIPFEKNNRFSTKEFSPRFAPSGCQNMTGEYLKNLNLDGSKKKCSEIMINKYVPTTKKNNFQIKTTETKISLLDKYKNIQNNIIHAGFYHFRESTYYFFKNTKFNNKSVVLYSIILASHNTRTPPRLIESGIVNTNTFPNLPPEFYEKIDAACYYNSPIIFLFNGGQFIKYNLRTRQPHIQPTTKSNDTTNIFKSSGLIRRRWPNIPYYFTYDLTAVVCRQVGVKDPNGSPNITWLFKGNQYIEISLDDINTTIISSPKNINTELGINISNVDTAMIYKYRHNNMVNDIICLFNKDRNVQYNFNPAPGQIIQNGVKNSIFFNNRNIWSININDFYQ